MLEIPDAYTFDENTTLKRTNTSYETRILKFRKKKKRYI